MRSAALRPLDSGLRRNDGVLLILPCAVDAAFDSAFDVPSPYLRRASQPASDFSRRLFAAGRGRMPKRPSSGQGWPVDGPRSGCGAQGTLSSRFFFLR